MNSVPPDNSLSRRMLTLEREVTALRREVAAARSGRLAQQKHPPQVFLGTTCRFSTDSPTYPLNTATAFRVRMHDPRYYSGAALQSWYTPGDSYLQGPNDNPEEEPPRCYNATGRWIPEGSLVSVVWNRGPGGSDSGEWWITSVLREPHFYWSGYTHPEDNQIGSALGGFGGTADGRYEPGDLVAFRPLNVDPWGPIPMSEGATPKAGIEAFSSGSGPGLYGQQRGGIKANASGLWLLGMSALIKSPTAPDDGPVGLGIYSASDTALCGGGWRQEVETDAYGAEKRRWQWVAQTMPVPLKADAKLYFKIAPTSYSLIVQGATWFAMLIQRHEVP